MEPTEGFLLAGSEEPDSRESQADDREQPGTAVNYVCVSPETLELPRELRLIKHTFFPIRFIGVTLINDVMEVSSVQFCNTSSVYCVTCSLPKV